MPYRKVGSIFDRSIGNMNGTFNFSSTLSIVRFILFLKTNARRRLPSPSPQTLYDEPVFHIGQGVALVEIKVDLLRIDAAEGQLPRAIFFENTIPVGQLQNR